MNNLGLHHNNTSINKTYILVQKSKNQLISGHITFLRNKFNLVVDKGNKKHCTKSAQKMADLVTFTGEVLKGYLRYKTIFCNKVAKLYLKKKQCCVLEISRFLCFCEINRFQNL